MTDSEYETPVCGICKGELKEDNVLRLNCMHMFHPECLDNYAASLPSHTAKAGYLCPTCSTPLFPADESNPLSQKIMEYIKNASWAKHLIEKKPDPPSNDEPKINFEEHSSGAQEFSPGTSQQFYRTPSSDSQDTYRIASRKPQAKEYSISVNDEDEGDKYERKGIMQLFVALGLVKPQQAPRGRQVRIRFDKKRVLFILALLIGTLTIILMGIKLTTDPELEDSISDQKIIRGDQI